MQPRERKLAIITGVLLAVAAGYWFYNGTIKGRFQFLDDQKTLVEKSVSKLEDEQFNIQVAERNIADLKSRSFPPDDVAAQRMYLAWLTDLVQSVGFSSPKLTPARGTPNKVYSSFRVTIEAEATFPQLCTFLFQFRRTDLLHRIASLTVEGDKGQSKTPLKVNIVAEGLSMKSAAPRAALFPKTEFAAAVEPSGDKLTVAKTEGFPKKGEFLVRAGSELLRVQSTADTTWTVLRGVDGTTAAAHKQGDVIELLPLLPEWKDRKLEDFRALTSQNPFAKPEKPKPPETPKKEEPKPVVKLDDPAMKTTKFVGATVLNDEPRICFLDPAGDKRTYVKIGENFAVAGIKGTLVEVHSNHILVQIEQDKWRLDLGKELAALKKLDRAGTPMPNQVKPPVEAVKPTSPAVGATKPSGDQPKAEAASAGDKPKSDTPGRTAPAEAEKDGKSANEEKGAPVKEKPEAEAPAAPAKESSNSSDSASAPPAATPADAK